MYPMNLERESWMQGFRRSTIRFSTYLDLMPFSIYTTTRSRGALMDDMSALCFNSGLCYAVRKHYLRTQLCSNRYNDF